eukprot:TRINITY_DN51373_c0_g1_i1.p1 TRINITY_DN51373_c0_g1~~TRINITY_DN51373_c0_g1_i1.p1  ORF type:complete len:537 (+),score=171.84 TRINITY_DN51373_c0_g1_i1:115-1725(+)
MAAEAPAVKHVDDAERFRSEGNAKFQAADIAGAKACYEKALSALDSQKEASAGAADTELAARAKACRVPAQLNLALCCLRSEPCDAWRALQLCEEVLDAEPDNAKATYRKAKALIELEEFKEAEWELVRACKLQPKDAAIRADLEKLRQRLKDSKEKQQETFKGLFERKPGFASENRVTDGGGYNKEEVAQTMANMENAYNFFNTPDDNPFTDDDRSLEKARTCVQEGKLEDAVAAYEATTFRCTSQSEWATLFFTWLEMAKLYMDMNLDRLALKALNQITERTGSPYSIPATCKRHARLLRAICLLNEAQTDPLEEISKCLEDWLTFVKPEEAPGADVGERLAALRADGSAGADAAIGHCLLLLVKGDPEGCLKAIAASLKSPEQEDGAFFSHPARRAAKWNMLGAVLANRGQQEQALVAYEQALQLQPQYPRALNNQGIAFEGSGDVASAAKAYGAALQISPDWASQAFWPMLRTVSEKPGSPDGLEEAAKSESLAKVREILQLPSPDSAVVPPMAPQSAVNALVDKLGFADSC